MFITAYLCPLKHLHKLGTQQNSVFSFFIFLLCSRSKYISPTFSSLQCISTAPQWLNSNYCHVFFLTELIHNGRLLTLPLAAGDLHSLLPDEDGRNLYVAMKDNLLSTSLDDITQNPRKVRTAEQPALTYQHICVFYKQHTYTYLKHTFTACSGNWGTIA